MAVGKPGERVQPGLGKGLGGLGDYFLHLGGQADGVEGFGEESVGPQGQALFADLRNVHAGQDIDGDLGHFFHLADFFDEQAAVEVGEREVGDDEIDGPALEGVFGFLGARADDDVPAVLLQKGLEDGGDARLVFDDQEVEFPPRFRADLFEDVQKGPAFFKQGGFILALFGIFGGGGDLGEPVGAARTR